MDGMRLLRGIGLAVACAAAGPGCRSEGAGIDPGIEKLGRATGPVERRPRDEPGAGGGGERAAGAAAVHEGEVVERIHVPNYTYLRLRGASGAEEWAAVPKAEIGIGARVRVVESLVMERFRSPTLDRVFDAIVFGVLEGAGPADGPRDAGAAPGR